MKYRVYVLSGDDTLENDDDFTTETIMSLAIDFFEAESMNEMLHQFIDRLNNAEISDQNWYFLYELEEMTLISKLPNGFM